MARQQCPDTALRPRAAQWPIAAALLQLPATDEHGTPTTELPAEEWHRQLQQVSDLGYTSIELPSSWVRVGDLSASRLDELNDVVRSLGLSIAGVSVVRESVIHPTRAEKNLEFSRRTLDAAAALGVTVVCYGPHDALTPQQQEVQWFWTIPGTPYPTDPDVRDQAIRAYRSLAEHAGSLGLQISIEMYEDTFLGTGAGAIRFLDDINHPAAGLNPDLGNLIRRQGHIEAWQDLVIATMPRANYWHVKNYARLEDPASGRVFTHPTGLDMGIIDYRQAIPYAVSVGFTGPIVVEHYGGDTLSVGARHERYVRSLLPKDSETPPLPTVALTRRAQR
ncbi:sugar phosphate isomerase/epimerase family protein [Microbacterium sp. YY-01]|uniref:sugar phosphate isomerase/epimerase family protein n=1 Tax=Microbacterium sp. YY-01 TaxID=3421634 RepID=UPI003D184742